MATRERTSKRSFWQQLRAGWRNHLDCLGDAWKRLIIQPLSALMTLMVLGITLLLPTVLYVLASNVAQFSSALTQSSQITAFLTEQTSEQLSLQLLAELAEHPLVMQADLITPAQAAEEFAAWSGLGDVLNALGDNPLPASIQLVAVDNSSTTTQTLADWLSNRPEVELVQFDQQWLQRLASAIRLIERLTMALIAVLALAVLFVTGNSIRTVIAGRVAEIQVMNLMGATRAYILRPFLYMGLIYGVLGAGIAWVMLQGLLALIREPAAELLAFYGDQYRFIGLSTEASATLLAGGAALGWLGARLSASRHLRQLV